MANDAQMVQKMTSLNRAVCGPDAEDLGYLVEKLVSVGHVEKILSEPHTAFTLAVEALRYAYALGYRRAQCENPTFAVTEDGAITDAQPD